MKKLFFSLLFLSILPFTTFSNGICIVDASTGSYFSLVSSSVEIQINNQIAIVKTTQVFQNNTGASTNFKYGFPMPESGSATSLRWQNGQFWYEAIFSPVPQDTIIPGGGGDVPTPEEQIIKDYLGQTPLYFEPNHVISDGAFVTMELTYVQLLPYAFNKVSIFYPNDYSSLQFESLATQELSLVLNSDREIEFIDLLSPGGADITNDGHTATVNLSLNNASADFDYYLEYELNADELGLFNFSTFLPEEAVQCDSLGKGFLAFVVEPDPSENTAIIGKEFTLIVDESGSMGGNKMVQAKDAATFIVNNLNPGDYFNIISFDSNVTSFRPDHVLYNVQNANSALNFISGLTAGGGTNIAGAFSEAIPQFENSDDDIAKIIIFFTDGKATAGSPTSTQGILNHVQSLRNMYDVQDLNIFTFGIGPSVNNQLLSQLATQNNGLAEFLQNDELQEVISDFYLTIQNPVLLNTQMTFIPPIVTEAYPQPLPNLFKGQQLIVVGRYDDPQEVTVVFSGFSFGNPVEYQYTFDLADTIVQENQFLPRLWAKKKMEHMHIDFYNYSLGSPEATAIEDEIIDISLCYGVISPFTSFGVDDGGGSGSTVDVEELSTPSKVEQLIASPNPFREQVKLKFELDEMITNFVWIEIFDSKGELVRRIKYSFTSGQVQEITWDGNNQSGVPVAPGVYIAKMKLGTSTYMGKIVRI